MTSYLHLNALSDVLRKTFAYTGKHGAVTASPLAVLEEDEGLARQSIAYAWLLRHETIYCQALQSGRQKRYCPRAPVLPGEGSDDDAPSRSESVSSLTSSSASSVFDAQLVAQLEEDGADEVDVRIAVALKQRERQGRRRLRAQRQTDHSWSTVKKTAPFDNLVLEEQDVRGDLAEIEEEFAAQIWGDFSANALTGLAALQCSEQRGRALLLADEIDACGDNARAAYSLGQQHLTDSLRHIVDESVARSRVLSDEGDNGSSSRPRTAHFSASSSSAAASGASPASASTLVRVRSGAPPPPRDPMPVPAFAPLSEIAVKRAAAAAVRVVPAKSDEQIMLEMAARKERYAREDIERRFEPIDFQSIVAQEKQERTEIRLNSRCPRFEPGSLNERIANAHRVDLRPARF